MDRFFLGLFLALFTLPAFALTPCGQDEVERDLGPKLSWTNLMEVNFEMTLPFGVGRQSGEGIICIGIDPSAPEAIKMVLYRDDNGTKRHFTPEELKKTKALLSKDDLPTRIHIAVRNGTLVTLKIDKEQVRNETNSTRYDFRIRFLRNMVRSPNPFSNNDYRQVNLYTELKHENGTCVTRYQDGSKPQTFDEFKFYLKTTAIKEMILYLEGHEQKTVKTKSLSEVEDVW